MRRPPPTGKPTRRLSGWRAGSRHRECAARFLVVATLVADRLGASLPVSRRRRLHFAGEIHLLIANANQVIACRIQLNASPVEFGLQGIERFVGITQISKHVKRFMDSVIDHARRGGRDQTTPETGLTLPAVESPNLGLGPHLAQRMGFCHLGDRAPGAAPNCSTRRPNSTAGAERKSSYRARTSPVCPTRRDYSRASPGRSSSA